MFHVPRSISDTVKQVLRGPKLDLASWDTNAGNDPQYTGLVLCDFDSSQLVGHHVQPEGTCPTLIHAQDSSPKNMW